MSESLQHDMENETTSNRDQTDWQEIESILIESILPRSVLDLVRRAPANPMTRGQVRAHTNLVYPDEVNTTEGIKEYVLENYDRSKVPQLNREAPRRYSTGESIVTAEITTTEREYGTASYGCTVTREANLELNHDDIDGMTTKEEVLDVLEELLRQTVDEAEAVDYDNWDYSQEEATDSTDREADHTPEILWETYKETIARQLGLTVEEMER